jgi:hypothetical protein
LLQAAEYDRIRRTAPQQLSIADWIGLQLYDNAQQVWSACRTVGLAVARHLG